MGKAHKTVWCTWMPEQVKKKTTKQLWWKKEETMFKTPHATALFHSVTDYVPYLTTLPWKKGINNVKNTYHCAQSWCLCVCTLPYYIAIERQA
jgi:hypothetical protein